MSQDTVLIKRYFFNIKISEKIFTKPSIDSMWLIDNLKKSKNIEMSEIKNNRPYGIQIRINRNKLKMQCIINDTLQGFSKDYFKESNLKSCYYFNGVLTGIMAGYYRNRHNENWTVLGPYFMYRYNFINGYPIGIFLNREKSFSRDKKMYGENFFIRVNGYVPMYNHNPLYSFSFYPKNDTVSYYRFWDISHKNYTPDSVLKYFKLDSNFVITQIRDQDKQFVIIQESTEHFVFRKYNYRFLNSKHLDAYLRFRYK